jgi:membrane fusion protein, heavy metal efflux system
MKYYLNIIFFTVLFVACTKEKKEEKTVENVVSADIVTLSEPQSKIANIQTADLQKGNISTKLIVHGTIDVPPQNLISISAPMGSYLKNTKLLPGMHVSKGEVIATLEDQQFIELQQSFLLTKSKLHFAELEYNRQKALNASQASSNKITEQADAELRTNRIILSGLTEKLKFLHINPANLSEGNISKTINLYSPINGFVSKINVNIGKYVNPSDILFELVNPTDIHLNIKIYEKDLAAISIGKKVIANTNSNPNQKYLCEIILISKQIEADGSVDVHCHFETYDKTLLPGMYMNAEIETKILNVNTLPENSVVNFEGKSFVFIDLGQNKYKIQEVQIGQETNGNIEIKNIVELKDKKIVTEGAYTLLMAMKNVEE